MSDELQALKRAVGDFQREADLDFVDAKDLSALVDSLQGTLCAVLHRATKNSEHLLAGKTPTGWVAQTCGLTPNAASDRLCGRRAAGVHAESRASAADRRDQLP